MRRLIQKFDEEDILLTHPIKREDINGWFFKMQEVSASHWIVEARDLYGRIISLEGNNPELLISECEEKIKELTQSQG